MNALFKHMNMKNYIISFFTAAVMALAASHAASAQSQGFKLGQWSEIQNSIIKELNKSYVDSLPVSRIMRAGVDAMLEELDPYTIYVPEEENENLQMMLSVLLLLYLMVGLHKLVLTLILTLFMVFIGKLSLTEKVIFIK